MNAKMSITVEIEEIPSRVSKYLEEVVDKLNIIQNDLQYCAIDIKEQKDLLSEAQLLDEVRKKLSTIDLNIEDCYSILKGYVSYKLEIQKKQGDDNNESIS